MKDVLLNDSSCMNLSEFISHYLKLSKYIFPKSSILCEMNSNLRSDSNVSELIDFIKTYLNLILLKEKQLMPILCTNYALAPR